MTNFSTPAAQSVDWDTAQGVDAAYNARMGSRGKAYYSIDDAATDPAASDQGAAPAPTKGPLTFEQAQAINATAPSAKGYYSIDDAAPPTAASSHAVATSTGNPTADTLNFLRTAAIHAASGILGPMGKAGAVESGQDPRTMPNAGQIEDQAFNSRLGPEYQPETTAGRYAMAGTTGALSSLVAPETGLPGVLLNAARGAGAGVLSQGAADAGVAPWVGALAAPFLEMLARGGYAGVKVAAPVVRDTTRAVVAPSRAGTVNAARVIAGVDNTLPALPQPTPADVAAARGAVQAATSDVGPGAPAATVGQQIRDDLIARQNALKTARTNATQPLADARDASTANVNIDPVVKLINRRLITAAGSQAGAINAALEDLKMPSGALRTQADQLAASRQAIGARISAAKAAGDHASVLHLSDIRDALDAQVNAAVPEAGQFTAAYQAHSEPLDVFKHGQTVNTVPDVVARDNFGNLNGTPASEIPDAFLTGKATKEKLDQLVSAYGGDKAAAESALQDHLAGVVQRSAVSADGTLDAAKFAKAIQPYQKVLNGNGGVWFPQLKAKFATAQAAQRTLDTVVAQRGLATSIASGDMRGTDGLITGQSFNAWLKANKDALSKAQSPSAVLRLQQIGKALNAAGGGAVDALMTEVLPTAVGAATGGVEGGILGGMMHKAAGTLYSPLKTRATAAFNAAIERAVQDPAYAQQLVARLPRAPYTVEGAARVLARAIGSSPVAAPRVALTTPGPSRSNYQAP